VNSMKHLTIRDAIATVVTAAVLVPFLGYSIRGSVPFIEDPRGMAGLGIVGILLIVLAFGTEAFRAGRTAAIMTVLAVVGLGFGVAALIAETSWVLLVPMVAALAALWLVGVVEDAGFLTKPPTVRSG